MTRTSSPGTMMLLFCMVLLAGIFALTTLSNASAILPTAGATIHQVASIEWLRSDQVTVPQGLIINAHAAKHNGDAERIYKLLLEGYCVGAAKFCGGSDIEKMYACIDPVTGLVGVMLQFGDDIRTGYFLRNSNNLENRVARENWRVCP